MNTIGKYRICGLLGRGGMSKVYKVKLPVIEKIAALKLLEPNPFLVNLMGAEKIRALFVSEALTMANLRHPNIVEIWGFDEADGKPFYLMDYYCNNLGAMIGETYQTETPSRMVTLDKSIHYTRQTLQGLACLHHCRIIHRDIKPYNILVTEHDTVKISDFGLSKLRGETFQGPANLKVGSPWYAAPEQEQNPDQVDFRADIYSVGVMLYRMLTGVLPERKPPREEAERPGKFNPDLDDAWDHFILRAIAPESHDRFGTAKEMLSALNALHAQWESKKEQVCNVPRGESVLGPKSPQCQTVRLRSRGIKVSPRQAQKVFSTDDLWRPLCYIQNDFKRNSADTIFDRATGLVWQQAGSDFPLTWNQTKAYIERLNEKRFAGKNNWRLPTVDELMSLLNHPPHGKDFCIEPIFDRNQKWLWSSDTSSFTSAWYVSIDMGFISRNDFTGFYYARAVCSA